MVSIYELASGGGVDLRQITLGYLAARDANNVAVFRLFLKAAQAYRTGNKAQGDQLALLALTKGHLGWALRFLTTTVHNPGGKKHSH
jgi:hypothetical protein